MLVIGATPSGPVVWLALSRAENCGGPPTRPPAWALACGELKLVGIAGRPRCALCEINLHVNTYAQHRSLRVVDEVGVVDGGPWAGEDSGHLDEAGSLPHASSRCGACHLLEVCSVETTIPELPVHLRSRVVERSVRATGRHDRRSCRWRRWRGCSRAGDATRRPQASTTRGPHAGGRTAEGRADGDGQGGGACAGRGGATGRPGHRRPRADAGGARRRRRWPGEPGAAGGALRRAGGRLSDRGAPGRAIRPACRGR